MHLKKHLQLLIYVTYVSYGLVIHFCVSLSSFATITTMAPSSVTVTVTSRFHESVTRNALRSFLSDFISTFFYVFLVVGAGMPSREYP